MKSWSATAVLLGALLVPGCGGDSPTEPAACTNLGGPWRVLFTNSCGVQMTDSLVIRQRACDYEAQGSVIPVSFRGTISGNAVTIEITFSGSCPGTATGTGTIRLDGVEGAFQATMAEAPGCCPGPVAGRFTFLPPL